MPEHGSRRHSAAVRDHQGLTSAADSGDTVPDRYNGDRGLDVNGTLDRASSSPATSRVRGHIGLTADRIEVRVRPMVKPAPAGAHSSAAIALACCPVNEPEICIWPLKEVHAD
jgi:hypothetical protein